MDFLIGKVGSILENETSLMLGLRDDLVEIQQELASMKAFLEDSEGQKAHSEVHEIQLASIRDMVYKVGDIIDEFMYHANQPRGGGRITGFLYQTIYFPKNLWIKHQIATKLQKIKQTVKNIADRRQRYPVERKDSEKWVKNQGESSLFMEEEEFIGIETKKKDLMGKLLDENPHRTVG